jgi:hypothetical protein
VSVRIARRGAIAASRVSAPSTVTVLTLPGTSGNYVSTPDSAAVSVTGDIDIRLKVAMTDWTPSEIKGYASRYGASGSRSYRFYIDTSGLLTLDLTSTGSGALSAVSSVATGFTDGTTHWVRVTWRNSDNRVQFFTSEDGSSWTQLGIDKSLDFTGIFDGTSPLYLGSLSTSSTTANLLVGTLYYFELRNGIDGTVVAKYDPSAVAILGTRNPTTLVASTGETWTMNGSAWDWATV